MSDAPSAAPPAPLIYEQAVSDRLRTFLRIEFLAQQFEHHCAGADASGWEARAAVRTLLEFSSLIGQRNIKLDLIKELDQRLVWLKMLGDTEGIDASALQETVALHEALREQAHGLVYPVHQHLARYELLSSVGQRASMPGCTSEADLPLYASWLHDLRHSHQALLREWYAPFDPVIAIARTVLQMIRDSAPFAPAVGRRGWFEQALDPARPNQMIRIRLEPESRFYPEISVSRRSFSIVFRDGANLSTRPGQTGDDVPFELACCLF